MAQKLKDELRQAIIEAAKSELLSKGYEDTSMRTIASKANMTVGNIYRYFDNKESIIDAIVSDTYKEIESLMSKINSSRLSMEARVFNLKANIDDLKKLMADFSDKLVDIYHNHQTEFTILILHSSLDEKIIKWFGKAIISLIEQHYLIEGHKKEVMILARAYAVSLFYGIREIFRINNTDEKTLRNILKTYLNSYVLLLDQNISRQLF